MHCACAGSTCARNDKQFLMTLQAGPACPRRPQSGNRGAAHSSAADTETTGGGLWRVSFRHMRCACRAEPRRPRGICPMWIAPIIALRSERHGKNIWHLVVPTHQDIAIVNAARTDSDADVHPRLRAELQARGRSDRRPTHIRSSMPRFGNSWRRRRPNDDRRGSPFWYPGIGFRFVAVQGSAA